MWQVVYITKNKKQAENLKDKLTQEGFLVKIEPMGASENDSYQVFVPESEAREVADYLLQC